MHNWPKCHIALWHQLHDLGSHLKRLQIMMSSRRWTGKLFWTWGSAAAKLLLWKMLWVCGTVNGLSRKQELNTFTVRPIFPWVPSRVGLLPRCQLVICCGAGLPVYGWVTCTKSLALTDAHYWRNNSPVATKHVNRLQLHGLRFMWFAQVTTSMSLAASQS